jgi:hypothetical protein
MFNYSSLYRILCFNLIFFVSWFLIDNLLGFNFRYLWVIEFIILRITTLLLLLFLYSKLAQTKFFIGLRKEILVFDLPRDNPNFLVKVREYHYLILIVSYALYTLSIAIVIDFPRLANFAAFVSIMGGLIYIIHFLVYASNYLKLNIMEIKANGLVKGTRSFSSYDMFQKASVVCLESMKVCGCFILVSELSWKMTHGGPNSIPPWREAVLNDMFPDDNTKVWSETKAGHALENRSIGNPHSDLYKDDVISKKLTITKGILPQTKE